MSNGAVLHLDEMLGQQELKVDWKGTSYPLKTQTDLTPEEFVEVMNMGEKFMNYASVKGDADISRDILLLVGRMLEIIAPELAAMKLPFNGQMLVLTFWKEQQAEKVKKTRAKAK